jgi:hypothetical protein
MASFKSIENDAESVQNQLLDLQLVNTTSSIYC